MGHSILYATLLALDDIEGKFRDFLDIFGECNFGTNILACTVKKKFLCDIRKRVSRLLPKLEAAFLLHRKNNGKKLSAILQGDQSG